MPKSETRNYCFFALDACSRAPLEDEFEVEGILRCAEPVRAVRIAGTWPAELRCEPLGGEAGHAYRCRGKYYQSRLVDRHLRLEIHLQSVATCSLEVEVAPPDPTPFREIFSSGLRFPEKVCLIAPGPSAAASVKEIPDCYARLAVNKAVLIPGANAAYWVMNQLTANSLIYFEGADSRFDGIRIFRLPTAWFWRNRVRAESSKKCFWFSVRQSPTECITAEACPPLAASVRSGATVAGCALQMLANLGAKEVLLCGLDMSGGTYWDGSTNIEDRQAGVWRQHDAMERLLEAMRNIGIKVQSLAQPQ
jgi:hypothetical protein